MNTAPDTADLVLAPRAQRWLAAFGLRRNGLGWLIGALGAGNA